MDKHIAGGMHDAGLLTGQAVRGCGRPRRVQGAPFQTEGQRSYRLAGMTRIR